MKKTPLFLFIFLFVVIAGLVIYFSLNTEVTPNLDTYIYDLPFKEGTSHKIVQGYGGMFSHKHKATKAITVKFLQKQPSVVTIAPYIRVYFSNTLVYLGPRY